MIIVGEKRDALAFEMTMLRMKQDDVGYSNVCFNMGYGMCNIYAVIAAQGKKKIIIRNYEECYYHCG